MSDLYFPKWVDKDGFVRPVRVMHKLLIFWYYEIY